MAFAEKRHGCNALRRTRELRCRTRTFASSSTCCASTANSSTSTGRSRLNDVGKAMKQSYVRQGPADHVHPERHRLSAGRRRLFHAQQGAARVRGGRGHDLRQGARRARQPDPADGVRGQGAVPRGGHHRRGYRHPALAGPDLQPEGRRPLHHARHRGVEGSRNRRPRYRPLPLSDPRQGYGLVLRAAVPPFRQESRQGTAARQRAEGGAGHRRRSDPRLHLPGAGARRRPTTGTSPAACAARRSSWRSARPATSKCRRPPRW